MRTDSRPRTRSRSVVRARKRARGELQSQAEEDWAPQTQEALRATALADALQRSVNNPNQLAWPDCAAWRSKSMFDVYYKVSQVVERDEWDAFSDSLRRPLPTTFRFTTEASAAFKSEGERILSGWASRGTRRLGVVDGWQLHLDKHELRAVQPRTQEATLREWLIRGTDAGHVVRQEVASMLPASLLDVLPDSVCLDMCASPGSKTTQLVSSICLMRSSVPAISVASADSSGAPDSMFAGTASAGPRLTPARRRWSKGVAAASAKKAKKHCSDTKKAKKCAKTCCDCDLDNCAALWADAPPPPPPT